MAYKYITNFDSPNFTPERDARAVFGQARVIKGITLHWWGDPNTNPSFEGVVNYLCRKGGNTSAHIVATGTGRRAACIVNYNDVAWHSGNATGNATTIGVELDPRCREEDYDVAAEVVADIRSAFGDVPIYSHNMWSATRCPGNYDIERVDRLSYTKISGKEWGQVTDKNPAPVTPVVPPVVPPVPPEANSPTASKPEQGGGQPVADKPDYAEEGISLLKQILAIIKAILDKLNFIK